MHIFHTLFHIRKSIAAQYVSSLLEVFWKTRNRNLRKMIFGYLLYIIPLFSRKSQFVFSNPQK